MASVPFCNLLLQLYTDHARKYFHKEMPSPLTFLKQHLNRPSKDFQQRFGAVSLAGNKQSCRVLCKRIGLQRNSEPLMYALGAQRENWKPRMDSEGGCWERKKQPEGALHWGLLSQDFGCGLCSAVSSFWCVYQPDLFPGKAQGLEA